jgi:hypothetical protein
MNNQRIKRPGALIYLLFILAIALFGIIFLILKSN